MIKAILNIIKGFFYYELCILTSKKIIINILCNILLIFTLINFKTTVLLYAFISFKVFLIEVTKYFIIALNIIVKELIGLIEGVGAANLIN